MRRNFSLFILVLTLTIFSSNVFAADSDPMGVVMSEHGNLNTFMELITVAGLEEYAAGKGNYTIVAPSDDAFWTMNGAELANLKTNPNEARRFVLYHSLHGRFGAKELRERPVVESVLGPDVVLEPSDPIRVNNRANLIENDILANNAIIHVADRPLDLNDIPKPPPPPPPAEGDEAPPAEDGAPAEPAVDEKPPWYVEPQPQSGASFGTPHENPAYVDGGVVEYWSGIQADSSSCKGMTWVVLRQFDGMTEVGADRQTNPYRGDTGCNEQRGLMCMERNMQPPIRGDFAENWSFGRVQATVPIPGTRLLSREHGNAICRNTFGHTYRMAEFHDGGLGNGVGASSGFKFWAFGGLEPGQRFWVAISDQAANPWNSYQPKTAPVIKTWVEQIEWVGQDSAFVGSGHMMPQEGLRASRTSCQGTTWVIHRQFNGLIQVGADRITNPYKGDTNCDKSYPVLCINVQGYTSPMNENGANFNHGWSGGNVDITYPYTGHQINSRDKANAKCHEHFGGGWRMASFHDGSLGTEGTDGWKFWAYGGLNTGRRFWVAVNDQPANPWNFTD